MAHSASTRRCAFIAPAPAWRTMCDRSFVGEADRSCHSSGVVARRQRADRAAIEKSLSNTFADNLGSRATSLTFAVRVARHGRWGLRLIEIATRNLGRVVRSARVIHTMRVQFFRVRPPKSPPESNCSNRRTMKTVPRFSLPGGGGKDTSRQRRHLGSTIRQRAVDALRRTTEARRRH